MDGDQSGAKEPSGRGVAHGEEGQNHRVEGVTRDEIASVTCTHQGWRASWCCKGSWVSWEACFLGLLALGSESCFGHGLDGL